MRWASAHGGYQVLDVPRLQAIPAAAEIAGARFSGREMVDPGEAQVVQMRAQLVGAENVTHGSAATTAGC